MAKWGCAWGGLSKWGGEDCLPGTWAQGFEANAKQDTVFLSKSNDGTISPDLETDRSQKGDDISASAGGGALVSPFESDYSRLTWTTYGAFEWVGDIADTYTGTKGLYELDCTNDVEMYIAESGSTFTLTINFNGGNELGWDITSYLSSTETTFAIGWSTRPNPDTTGASDAYVSEVYLAKTDASLFDKQVFTHALISTSGASKVYVLTTAANEIADEWPFPTYSIRFSTGRFHDSTEFWEDWVQTSSNPSITGESRFEMLVPDKASTIGDDGEFAGPVYSMVAAAHRKIDMRLASPIVNEVHRSWISYDDDFLPAQGNIAMPTDTTFTMMRAYLWHRPIPRTVNKLWGRAFVQTWVTAGDAVKLEIRLVSFNKLPSLGNLTNENEPAFEQYYRTAELTIDHGSGATAGEWVEWDLTKIAMDAGRFTYLALAFSVADGSGDADFLWRIKAVTICPILDKTTGGIPDDLQLKP